jgi:peptidyl-prolyl cis-trans isomerase B (cyclophilin B)
VTLRQCSSKRRQGGATLHFQHGPIQSAFELPQPVTKALMETEAGTIELELFDADAPNTVANFVKLAKDGFYDGLAFHRVIPGFMAQGGCPNSREGSRGMAGTGGPGYQIDCEINSQKHQAGPLAMAHAGRNTGGSQFYICHEAQPHLDGMHTVFGLTGNMDVVLALKNGSRINKVTILD